MLGIGAYAVNSAYKNYQQTQIEQAMTLPNGNRFIKFSNEKGDNSSLELKEMLRTMTICFLE